MAFIGVLNTEPTLSGAGTRIAELAHVGYFVEYLSRSRHHAFQETKLVLRVVR